MSPTSPTASSTPAPPVDGACASRDGARSPAGRWSSALIACVAGTLSCARSAPPQPAPALTGVTQAAAVAHAPVSIPPRWPAVPGKLAGAPGSSSVDWHFPGAPHEGIDLIRVAMSPRAYDNPEHNAVYWAFQGYFTQGEVYYFGLQPNGQYGKTALFSVFGKGSSPRAPSCKPGADNGSGTSCHIPYAWESGHAYQFVVALVAADADNSTWQGTVEDLATGVVTVIGDVEVTSAHGLLKAAGGNFAEYFHRSTPCPAQPRSEILFFQPVGYRNGHAFPGVFQQADIRSGCNPAFFGDGKTYVYVDIGP